MLHNSKKITSNMNLRGKMPCNPSVRFSYKVFLFSPLCFTTRRVKACYLALTAWCFLSSCLANSRWRSLVGLCCDCSQTFKTCHELCSLFPSGPPLSALVYVHWSSQRSHNNHVFPPNGQSRPKMVILGQGCVFLCVPLTTLKEKEKTETNSTCVD